MVATTEKITPLVGVEITGLSGHEIVDQRIADQCLSLLKAHGVVVYREANISDGDLVAFSHMLGEVVVAATGGLPDHPEISPISLDPAKSTLADYRKSTVFWHIDGLTDDVPQKATLLTAREVADEGGDTEFANTFAAYDALSDSEKSELEGIRVMHSFTASQLLAHPDATAKERAIWNRQPAREHPLVWNHADGRRSLLIGATAGEVVGMPPAHGRDLLARILDHATQPQFALRHQWRRGDLVVWDNTGMLHRALPYQPTSPRLMHRTTLVGEEAVA